MEEGRSGMHRAIAKRGEKIKINVPVLCEVKFCVCVDITI